ncbi:MAG: tRNA pseudouridine(55) synthase TruB [Planctomycetaceae bacterium]|nr:tRNA pseudouridine(55) synthase TruB [Planctomycetaceae bacterium]
MSPADEPFGLINLNKPAGWSSRKAVDHVKRLVKPAKIGHAGTLDPLATGVLILTIGKATRLTPFLHDLTKSYRAEFLLGHESETDDTEGDVQPCEHARPLTRGDIERVLPRFVGRIEQTPPIYSAVKIKGRRAYELARKGKTPDIKPRMVDIHRLEIVEFSPEKLVLEMDCGTGTYVRSVGRDLARAAGSCAVMTSLIRTRIGGHLIEDAKSPEEITRESLAKVMLPASEGVGPMRKITCESSALQMIQHGRSVPFRESSAPDDHEPCALLDPDGGLMAIAEYRETDRHFAPRHVFV